MPKQIAIAALLSLALTPMIMVHAASDPRDDPAVQKKLRAMANADTDWHPDLAGEFNGMRAYAHGDYEKAMQEFLSGAYYGDKLSQLSIGLMYLNGEGVAKDPVTAYAWLDLASERDFDTFNATRDRVKATLSGEQLDQAQTLRVTLGETYADDIAKPRLTWQLRHGQMISITGSRTGFNAGVYSGVADMVSRGSTTVLGATSMRCTGPTILLGYIQAPVSGCGGDAVFAPAFWQADKYFASRDALLKAEVVVGPLTQAGKGDHPEMQQAPERPL
jgi:hypothetical protein